MHVNNETGVVQPIDAICAVLEGSDAFFHVDAAQSFGKLLDTLTHPRIDLISASGHKIFGPKGVGVLIARRRGFDRAPLQPLMYGGGQERGLRPGTQPVHLIVGMGKAAEVAMRDAEERNRHCLEFRIGLLRALEPLEPILHGDPDRCVPHTVNVSVRGVDSEAAMVALKGFVAISNGSACTSASYSPSHVLEAMGLAREAIAGALRLSWSHLTPNIDWGPVVEALQRLRN